MNVRLNYFIACLASVRQLSDGPTGGWLASAL